MASPPITVLFLGATGGCALSALKRSLAAGHECVALVRTPAKLSALLPHPSYPNLRILEGNARDVSALSRALVVSTASSSPSLVNIVITSVGQAFSLSKFGSDDPTVCEKSMEALLSAVRELSPKHGGKAPRIIAVSSTGVSRFGRDIPLAMVPIYRTLIVSQHRDKRAMEDLLFNEVKNGGTGPEWTVVRPSMLTDDKPVEGAAPKPIRVSVEDPVSGVETREIGYTISREDVGRWIFEDLVQDGEAAKRFVGKIASITY